MEILAYHDDGMPQKTAYVEMVGELNLDDPEYAEFDILPQLKQGDSNYR